MSLYHQSTMPLRNLLLAVLLCLHIGCVLVEAFAASVIPDSADPHHSYGLQLSLTETAHSPEPFAASMTDGTTAAEHAKHNCDHCSHCHASHLGLFTFATTLDVSPDVLLSGYLKQPPATFQASIYRPPIA